MSSVDQVKIWLKPFLKENIDEYEIILENNSCKDSGYLSSIIYVLLKKSQDGKDNSNIKLAIKKGCEIEAVRSSLPIRDFFLSENFMYETVFPIFNKLQLKREVDVFDSFPKYYGHVLLKNSEVIIFENLQPKGYKLYDRKRGMDLDHCKLVLRAYAELHALSFALKDQDRETFDKISVGIVDAFKNWLADPSIEKYMRDQINNVLESLEINGDQTLHDLCKEELKDYLNATLALLNNGEEQAVFVHGDNWNNNYLFKYEENNNVPECVAILDWQLAAIRSPLIDVGKFLFSVCSKKELEQINDLLKYYYSMVSKYLISLGSDPDKVFSYADFKRHWKTYAWYGLLGGVMMLKLTMLDQEDAPSVDQLGEGKDYDEIFSIKLSGKELYYQRARDILEGYSKIKNCKFALD